MKKTFRQRLKYCAWDSGVFWTRDIDVFSLPVWNMLAFAFPQEIGKRYGVSNVVFVSTIEPWTETPSIHTTHPPVV